MRVYVGMFLYIYMYVYEFLYPKSILCPFLLENIYIIYCIYNIYLRVCKFEYSHFINNTSSKRTQNFCFFVLWLLVLEGFAVEILGFFSFKT